ncbi:MAG: MerR family transcriptional regulator [Anaerolineales bacterium]
MFTVKQLSTLAGVTPRALRHYDEIGLLKPSQVGANGYRYYDEDAALRLQQILFYRELDMPLAEIRNIMGRHDFEALPALESHKQALKKRMERTRRLLQTVDETIAHLKGKKEMSPKQLFSAFSEEEQEKLAQEAEKKYDPAVVRASNKKWKAYSQRQREDILAEGNAIYAEMVAAMSKGADSPEAQDLVARWRKHMDYFWTPSLGQLQGLAEMYSADPRFKANFDGLHPQLAEFMQAAVKIYVKKNK